MGTRFLGRGVARGAEFSESYVNGICEVNRGHACKVHSGDILRNKGGILGTKSFTNSDVTIHTFYFLTLLESTIDLTLLRREFIPSLGSCEVLYYP